MKSLIIETKHLPLSLNSYSFLIRERRRVMESSQAVSKVQGALVDLGFVIEREPVMEAGHLADLLARRGDVSYLVEVKHQVRVRKSQFLGAVAHGILELQYLGHRASGRMPLLGVW